MSISDYILAVFIFLFIFFALAKEWRLNCLLKKLPFYCDLRVAFVPGRDPCWVNGPYGYAVKCIPEYYGRWGCYFGTHFITELYSTKAAAEAATKGGE